MSGPVRNGWIGSTAPAGMKVLRMSGVPWMNRSTVNLPAWRSVMCLVAASELVMPRYSTSTSGYCRLKAATKPSSAPGAAWPETTTRPSRLAAARTSSQAAEPVDGWAAVSGAAEPAGLAAVAAPALPADAPGAGAVDPPQLASSIAAAKVSQSFALGATSHLQAA